MTEPGAASSLARVRIAASKATKFAAAHPILLYWPLALVLATLLAWLILLASLDAEKSAHEQAALKEAESLSRVYSQHLQQSLAAVDQISLYLKYAWEYSNGLFRLEGVDDAGLLPAKSGFYASVIGRDGLPISSTLAHTPKVNLSKAAPFVAQKSSTEDRFFIGRVEKCPFTGLTVTHFSRMLIDDNGNFAGIVLVHVVPEYFISGYDQATLGTRGFLGILGADRSVRVTRVGNTVFKPESQALLAAPPVKDTAGAVFVPGKGIFSDGRNRYLGWQATDRYGMVALAGLDQDTVLAPYRARRAETIRHAAYATVALAVFAIISTALGAHLLLRKRQLEGLQATYRMATEGGAEGFYIARPVRAPDGSIDDFEVVDCNRRGGEFFDLRREELIGRRLSNLYEGQAKSLVFKSLCKAHRTGFFEAEQAHIPGSPVNVPWIHVRIVRSGDDLAVTSRDISDSKKHVIELERRGNEDALTGLPNRHWMKDFLPGAVRRASERARRLAVLFIDLDGFKAVNDTMGHEAGDDLLRNAGRRLKLAVRPHDHVVRIGGDEFVVILENVEDKNDTAIVAERILAAFQEPFRLPQGVHSVGTSVGISIYPDDAMDVDALLKHADIAMYSVKSGGKKNYRHFDEHFYETVRMRNEKVADLRQAIAQDQFVVYYQPRIDVSTGAMSGMEALLRWAHPAKGMLEPPEFIPLAEETGLIVPLGEIVIERVCGQLANWARHDSKPVPVSINVSARQFQEAKVGDMLARALSRHGLPPDLIEIELTESSMMDGSEETTEHLKAIQKLGIKLVVDDFGTGHSSLSQLQQLDFDVLKIDRAFIGRLEKTSEGNALFTAIITMAHSLGMRVVAEGVEQREQVELLKSLHCDEIQGFYFSRPLPPADRQPVFRNGELAAAGYAERD